MPFRIWVYGAELLVRCTANIFNVIFTVFKCVPLSTVISLYGLHLIAAPLHLNNCKADLQFFYCNFYIGLYMAIKCKPYSEITVESGTQLNTVYICSVVWIREVLCPILKISLSLYCILQFKESFLFPYLKKKNHKLSTGISDSNHISCNVMVNKYFRLTSIFVHTWNMHYGFSWYIYV